jgi:hypothetical protein
MFEGGGSDVALATTLTLTSTTTVGIYCSQAFTLFGLSATSSMTATEVTNVH